MDYRCHQMHIMEGSTLLSTVEAVIPTFSFLFIAFVALLTGSALLAYIYAPYWGVRKVPGPPIIPLVGHLPLLAKYGPDVFGVLAEKYGPIYRFHLGRQPLVIIADAELCKEVGMKKFKSLRNRSIPSPIAGSPVHQKGLFFTRDSRWSFMRNTIISLYHPSHLSNLMPMMRSYINCAFSHLQVLEKSEDATKDITFDDLALKLSTDIIGQAAFGMDFGLSKQSLNNSTDTFDSSSNQASAFIKQHIYSTTSLKMDLSGSFSIILGLLLPILQEPFRQILKRIPWTADHKIDQTNLKLSKRLDEIVATREHDKEKAGKDFLSAILRARDSSVLAQDLFTSDYISALTYEHLLAGSATTSFTMSSVLYLISSHLEVEEKLLQEIDAFGPHDVTPTAHDLQEKFPYLDQVIEESMRFYTVSPLIPRETSKDVKLGCYNLPKGTWVWLAVGVLAKDAKYFPNPHAFRPERFDPNGHEEKYRHPYAHIPFGIGPRACIGQKFALQEIKLTIIYLYQRYIFRHCPEMERPLQFDYGIVLNFKHGVKLQVSKRKAFYLKHHEQYTGFLEPLPKSIMTNFEDLP